MCGGGEGTIYTRHYVYKFHSILMSGYEIDSRKWVVCREGAVGACGGKVRG